MERENEFIRWFKALLPRLYFTAIIVLFTSAVLPVFYVPLPNYLIPQTLDQHLKVIFVITLLFWRVKIEHIYCLSQKGRRVLNWTGMIAETVCLLSTSYILFLFWHSIGWFEYPLIPKYQISWERIIGVKLLYLFFVYQYDVYQKRNYLFQRRK